MPIAAARVPQSHCKVRDESTAADSMSMLNWHIVSSPSCIVLRTRALRDRAVVVLTSRFIEPKYYFEVYTILRRKNNVDCVFVCLRRSRLATRAIDIYRSSSVDSLRVGDVFMYAPISRINPWTSVVQGVPQFFVMLFI
ncbi:hypothetical protein [Burkholderia cepacia]|uniref:hypothetical protein n=1 Tax=Burkholderia cepacia TaxID=292 RepID=UPI0011D1CCC8|nr:hypothetical protein [Burkholderia cepacia]